MKPARGFSLFELAIVMLISGIMLVGVARLFETLQLQQALKTTRERMEKIQQQLDAFADMNERFPCPLTPAAGPLAPEPESCTNPELAPGARDVAIGVLPVKSLELTPQDVEDGWGNLFTYAVSARLTKEGSMRGVNPPTGVIDLVNGYGDSLLDPPQTGRYVVISHGPNGSGGFTPKGVAIPCREGTLSAKNCHAPTDFVASPWSTAPGPFFFDNIVVADPSRRQAHLLAHLDYCGRLGKYYAPERFYADAAGCVADDKVYGACTLEASYRQHGAMDPFTGDWQEVPAKLWWPAKTEGAAPFANCACEKHFDVMAVVKGELPRSPAETLLQNCEKAFAHEWPAIPTDTCSEKPPYLDVKMQWWKYDYLAIMDGRVLKTGGEMMKAVDGRNWGILPMLITDPDNGGLVWAKAAGYPDKDMKPFTWHIPWSIPATEINHKMTLSACIRR